MKEEGCGFKGSLMVREMRKGGGGEREKGGKGGRKKGENMKEGGEGVGRVFLCYLFVYLFFL